MVRLKNAPTKPCTKICVGKTHVFDVLNGKQAAWCRHPIQNIEKDLIEIDFTSGLFDAQSSTIPTFPFSFEMFGKEDSEDSAETKSPTSVIEIEDAVMN